MNTDPAAQLADHLDTTLVGGLEALGWTDLAQAARERIVLTALTLITRLEDPDEGPQTVIDLAGTGWPEHPEPEWWTTPLGRLVARVTDAGDDPPVTQEVAARMLGVTRGTVAQLLHRGTLPRHPNGGVPTSAVLNRLTRGRA